MEAASQQAEKTRQYNKSKKSEVTTRMKKVRGDVEMSRRLF